MKPWAFHDSMMILNKDKPEMKLTNVAEVGGVSKSRTENDEEVQKQNSAFFDFLNYILIIFF